MKSVWIVVGKCLRLGNGGLKGRLWKLDIVSMGVVLVIRDSGVVRLRDIVVWGIV